MTSGFKAVLFDWKGTLFYDESDHDWLRHSAESIGLQLTPDAVQAYVDAIDRSVAVVSDIHYDVRPLFAHYGLAAYVDTFVLSFEHGIQKPHRRMFRAALDALGVAADEALMVGDRAGRDGGAVDVGITTLLLPAVPRGAPRGLDLVLRVVGA